MADETPPPRRYIIAGDRNWKCEDVAYRVLDAIRGRHGLPQTVVHGGCRGVDMSFDVVARRLGFDVEVHPAEGFGSWPACGPRRNAYMASLGADYAIAVHRSIGWSKGTKDCARKCLKAGIPVYLVNGVNPTRSLKIDDPIFDR